MSGGRAQNFYDPGNCGVASVLKDAIILLFQILIGYIECFFRFIVPKQLKSLAGEVVLVTGGGHGIGKEFAKQISRLGVKAVVIWDINEKNAETTAKEIFEETGVKAKAVQCDVSDRAEVAKAAKITRDFVGPVTVLYNNAGIMPCKPFFKHSASDIVRVFEVNVYSQFWTLFEFLPEFLERNHGHIISMSSTAGVTGTPNLTAYCSTKHAIKGLMEALFLELRQEYKDHKVNTTTIYPFTVNTGLAQKPTTRFDHLIPITEPEEAARIIIESMRRDEKHVFIPRRLAGLFAPVSLFPISVKLALFDFLGCGVGAHD